MQDEYERLRRRISDGLEAVEELKRLEARERRERQKRRFRVIKGSVIGGAIWAGVEWFRDYRRTTTALAATGVTVASVMVMDLPDAPDPKPPDQSTTEPSVIPTPRASKTSPPRTSPLRTVRSSTPVAAPASKSAKPTARPTPPPAKPKTIEPKRTKPPKILVIPKPTELVDNNTLVTPSLRLPSCPVDLLGVKLCLPRGRS